MIEKFPSFFKKGSQLFGVLLSNAFTALRVMLAGVVVWQVARQELLSGLVWFSLALISDFLDGFFARIFDAQTEFGRRFDPLADKMLLLSSLASLFIFSAHRELVPQWFLIFLVVREFTIVLGTCGILLIRGSVVIKPTLWGKLTTALQGSFIFLLFLHALLGIPTSYELHVFLYLVVIFSFFSLMHYIKIGINQVLLT